MRPIRLLTWNIHGFLGQDGRFDPDRVARIVRDLEPDIAAVQEVIGPDLGVDGFALLRRTVPQSETVAANVNRKIRGIYGQVLISRFQVRRWRRIDLSVPGREPRRAIDAVLETPGAPTRVIATHLGLAGPERQVQVGILRRLVDEDPDTDTVVLGDINDWRRGGYAERQLAPLLGPGTRSRTFPAAFPLFPLDRMWVRPAERLVDARVHREAALASDHLPLVADLLPPAGQRPAAVSAMSSQRSSMAGSASGPVGSE